MRLNLVLGGCAALNTSAEVVFVNEQHAGYFAEAGPNCTPAFRRAGETRMESGNMNFTPENAKKVMDGTKTQTRRIAKSQDFCLTLDGMDLCLSPEESIGFKAHSVFSPTLLSNNRKYEVGATYAVCPGRGKKAIGRIRVTAIRCEKVQDISADDCWAEGISRTVGVFMRDGTSALDPVASFAVLWNSIYKGQKGKQWADNPLVWVLTFEVVK